MNDILANNKCYYKEVFDMYNYIMLLMFAIEQEREKEYKQKHGSKSQEQINKERIGDLKKLLGDDSPVTAQEQGLVTIEVTPEDMKNASKERKERQEAIKDRKVIGKKLPPRTKPPRSTGK